MRAKVPWSVLAIVFLTSHAAHGQDRDQAARLLDEGVALFGQRDYRGALERFERAYAAYPSPKIFYNVAGALEKLGREAEAAQAYDRFLTETAPLADVSAERKAAARQSLAELGKRLGRLTLPAGASGTVTLDGLEVSVPPGRPFYVAPGKHAVAVTDSAGTVQTGTIDVAAGEAREVQLEARPAAPPPAVRPPPPPVDAGPRRRVWTWVAAGAAAAFLGVGVAAGLSADAAYDDYKAARTAEAWQDRRDAVRVRSAIANVAFVAAGAAAIGAGVLFFVEGREARVTAAASSNGGLLTVTGAF